jgi:TPP-dependent pyruvate/acetoin dehydrogenase alpha subunit
VTKQSFTMSEIKKQLLDLMLKIRIAEEKIVEVYAKEQQMRTPTHLSIGQEAVAAALSLALQADDQLFVGHRCHSSYLAKGGDFQGFFDELCGRQSGICAGRAGSAHLTDPSVGVYASPILSAMIPVAVGAAMSFKMDKLKRVAVAVFGDAAIEEGAFAESVNFAVTHQLPVLFLCENNLYSTHTPLSVRQPPSKIIERFSLPEMPGEQIDGNDACLLYERLKVAIEHVRSGQGPLLMECLTYRVREHVGPLFDYDRGYRTKEEVETWMKRCPIALLTAKLIKENILSSKEAEAMKDQWQQKADQAYVQALKAPWPDVASLEEHVY